jgi:hypothetical protein
VSRRLSADELEEVRNLAAESELDHGTALARAAELRDLRRLHRYARFERFRLGREIRRIPEPGDTAGWSRMVQAAEREHGAVEPGSADLVSGMRP